MSNYKKNIEILEKYKTVYKRKFKNEISNLIDVYKERKVFNVKTVKKVLDKMTNASDKKGVASGLTEYDKLYDKYKEAEPVPVKRKRVKEEKILNEKKGKAVFKIQNLFRNAIVFDIKKKESAFDDKVVSYTVRPQRIGKIAAIDIKAILYKSLMKVLKLLPKKAAFNFYSELKLRSR